MGMIVHVFRGSLGDCTAGGVSSKVNELTVVNVDGPFEPTDERPAAVLKDGHLPGTCRLVPVAVDLPKKWLMFGGNYASTSDSRWHRAVDKICGSRQSGAVSIHDRVEEYGTY